MARFRAERLAALRKELDISQEELARRTGSTQPSINRLEGGGTERPRNLVAIARELQCSPEYLLGETDDPSPLAGMKDKRLSYGHEPAHKSSDLVELAEFDVAYGLGATYIHDEPQRAEMRTFSRAWIRHFTKSPVSKLFWATGSGTSMTPVIQENDLVLIDTDQQTPRMWDHLWAIEMHGMGMIKALRPGKDGAMRIISLNPSFPEEVAVDGEMNVVGRVVAVVRKL